ncbi:MAG: hypothetical protein P8R42_08310 [Candidatus Binatia bacterium]|nr:hypothetical protein [Candidatus Binatia bacterium]
MRRQHLQPYSTWFLLILAMVLIAPQPARSVLLSPLTTADGAGADGYAPIFAGSPFDDVTRIKVKLDRGSGGVQNKGYIRFDLSAVTDPLSAVELILTLDVEPEADAAPGETVGVDSFEVYGLNDGHPGEAWVETGTTGISWVLAPGNDMASPNGVLAEETTFLGTFDLVSGVNAIGDPASFTSAALLSFLQADTDDLVTLILVRTDKSFAPGAFATKEHPTAAPPTLDITTVISPPVLDPIAAPIFVGAPAALAGSGFTAGSVVKAFVATATGPLDFGPFTPTAWSPTSLTWEPPGSMPLGNGFVTLLIVNTDEGFTQSGTQSQLLLGSAGLNIPSILGVNAIPLTELDPTIPTANIETILAQGATLTVTGSGFNGPLVNLFTAIGNVGPLSPLPGGDATTFQIVIPGPTVTGPGSLQVVNNPYVGNVLSNAVSVPIGAALDITSISQSGTTVTVNGAGFSALSVINFFAQSGASVSNFGGLDVGGASNIPLNIVSENQFTFTVPVGADAGAAYVMVLNPPFIQFSSTTGDPDGGFTLTVF